MCVVQKIVVKGSEGELKTVKELLKNFSEADPSLSISGLRYGSLGDENILSFNVDNEHYNFIIGKFALYRIKLLMSEEKIIKAVSKTKNNFSPISPIDGKLKKTNTNESPSTILDDAIKLGDYEKVIQMSKDFRNGLEVIQRAKENIDLTIKIAIDIAFSKATKNKYEINDSILRLIKIASDTKLRALHKIDFLKDAGFLAVNLCSINNEYINLLVQICNNNSIPNIVSVKAAIKLSEIIFNNSSEQNEDFQYAVRYLNVKWLLITFDVASKELSKIETESFNLLIKSIAEWKEKKNSTPKLNA